MKKNLIYVAGVVVALAPVAAFADTFATSSAAAVITSGLSDTGYLLVLVVGAIFATTVALMGAGYAIRHISKRLLGRKF